jgi:hypothetical protein
MTHEVAGPRDTVPPPRGRVRRRSYRTPLRSGALFSLVEVGGRDVGDDLFQDAAGLVRGKGRGGGPLARDYPDAPPQHRYRQAQADQVQLTLAGLAP